MRHIGGGRARKGPTCRRLGDYPPVRPLVVDSFFEVDQKYPGPLTVEAAASQAVDNITTCQEGVRQQRASECHRLERAAHRLSTERGTSGNYL
jgi:hypothetical protein